MKNLKQALPWFLAILAGMWLVWSFFLIGVAALSEVDLVLAIAEDYALVLGLIVGAPPFLWLAWCLFRRKWMFIGVSLSASLVTAFVMLLFIFMVFASLPMS